MAARRNAGEGPLILLLTVIWLLPLALGGLCIWAAWTHVISGIGWPALWGSITGLAIFWFAVAFAVPVAAAQFCRLLTPLLLFAGAVGLATQQWGGAVALLVAAALSHAVWGAAKGVGEGLRDPAPRPSTSEIERATASGPGAGSWGS